MAVKDIKSNLLDIVAVSQTISTDTTTNGTIIDNADYELGLMFVVQCTDYTDGTYDFTITEGDASDLSDGTAVPTEKLIGALNDLTITGANSEGNILNSIGVFSNKRYVRLNVVSTGTTSGATINAIATQKGEILPV